MGYQWPTDSSGVVLGHTWAANPRLAAVTTTNLMICASQYQNSELRIVLSARARTCLQRLGTPRALPPAGGPARAPPAALLLAALEAAAAEQRQQAQEGLGASPQPPPHRGRRHRGPAIAARPAPGAVRRVRPPSGSTGGCGERGEGRNGGGGGRRGAGAVPESRRRELGRGRGARAPRSAPSPPPPLPVYMCVLCIRFFLPFLLPALLRGGGGRLSGCSARMCCEFSRGGRPGWKVLGELRQWGGGVRRLGARGWMRWMDGRRLCRPRERAGGQLDGGYYPVVVLWVPGG